MAKLLEKSNYKIPTLRYGDIIEGKVVYKGRGELLIDIGAKSEGIISGRELEDDFNSFKAVKVGDPILCSVIQAENDQGFVVLSLRRASRQRKWLEFKSAQSEGQTFKVQATGFNRGGLVVRVNNDRGFIPLSHLDPNHFQAGKGPEDLSDFVGKTLEVQLIEVDREKNRLVLSERKFIFEKGAKKRQEKLKKLKVGQKVKGLVSSTTPFGVFLDLGDGLEGIIHLNELSWERVANPADLFRIGDEVEAKILSLEKETERLSLSIKTLTPDPWEGVEKSFKVGKKVKGEVTNIAPFGAFVRLKPGVEGLIHLSEATGPLKVGEKIEAIVVAVDREARKIGLSVKQLDSETASQ